MGLVRLPCFFNSVQRIERYSTTSSKMIKNGIGGHLFSNSKPWKQAPNHHIITFLPSVLYTADRMKEKKIRTIALLGQFS